MHPAQMLVSKADTAGNEQYRQIDKIPDTIVIIEI